MHVTGVYKEIAMHKLLCIGCYDRMKGQAQLYRDLLKAQVESF